MAKVKKLKDTIINANEFEGLAGFEEIHSLKLIKESKHFGRKSTSFEVNKDIQLYKNYDGKKQKRSRNFEPLEMHSASNHLWNQDVNALKKKVNISIEGNCNTFKRQKFSICESDWRAIFTPDEVIEAIKKLGFQHPTEIQKLTIPAAINKRRDIIGAAETGSGKTLAFAIPVVNGILKMQREDTQYTGKQESFIESDECHDSGSYGDTCKFTDDDSLFSADSEDCNMKLGCVKVIDNIDCKYLMPVKKKLVSSLKKKPLLALFITPTRELAIQIKKHVDAILIKTSIKAAVIIGGLSHAKQNRVLNSYPEIVIGTPGRLWELLQQGNEHLADLSNIRYLVIDETDRMLEKGHFEELKQLLAIINENSEAKKKRQTFIFSATLTLKVAPPKRLNSKRKVQIITSEMKIENLIKLIGIRDKPKIVDITRKLGTATLLSEAKINCDKEEKDVYLYYFIKKFPGRTLVFCNSINCVKRLSNLLNVLQCKSQALHASKHQKQRLKSLEHFSSEEHSILLATDVAARGIDISGINHVIHYEFPRTAEIYIHRSGRTARANQEGISILLIDHKEMEQYKNLCLNLGRSSEIPSLPLEDSILQKVKESVHLAQSIETAEHTVKKKQEDQSWFEKMAEEAGLIWEGNNRGDDDDFSEELHSKKKKCIEISSKKAHLNQLLSTPILPTNSNFRYPTAAGTRSFIHLDSKRSAIEMLKGKKKAKKSKDISVPTGLSRKKINPKKNLTTK